MIAELSTFPEHSNRVLAWLRSTWDDPSNVFANTLSPASDCPGALIAIADGVPLGVLTFRRHRTSVQATHQLWINALYVVPTSRRLGLGRKLIRAAVERSIPKYTERLFVFTDVPTLYDPMGWKRVDYNAEFSSFTLRFERVPVVSTGLGEPNDARELPS